MVASKRDRIILVHEPLALRERGRVRVEITPGGLDPDAHERLPRNARGAGDAKVRDCALPRAEPGCP